MQYGILDLKIGIKYILSGNYHSYIFKNKNFKFLVPNNVKLNKSIECVQKLNELEERLVSPRLAFAQI